jgi:hypothetical protein
MSRPLAAGTWARAARGTSRDRLAATHPARGNAPEQVGGVEATT